MKTIRKKGFMNKIIGILNAVIPMLVVAFCCWFFYYAFERTCSREKSDIPTVNVFLGTNVTAKTVETVLCGEKYQSQLKVALESREAIVRAEHDNFRAELGTWLSIFGLLSILATISVAAFSYVCQQASLRSERDEIKKTLEGGKEDVEEKFTNFENRLSELKDNLEKEVRAKQDEIGNVGVAVVSEIMGESPLVTSDADESPQVWGDKLKSVQDESKLFIKMWAQKPLKDERGPFDKKIRTGIRVLKKFNELIKNYIGNAEVMTEILKKFNLINIYLGQEAVKTSEFYGQFVQELKERKPLKVSYAEVKKCLKDNDKATLIAGYYGRGVYELQEGL